MANPKITIPLRSPLVDTRGLLTSPWAQFFQAVYGRIGGAEAISIKEVHESAFDDAGIAEQQAEIDKINQNMGQLTAWEILQAVIDYLPATESVQPISEMQPIAPTLIPKQEIESLQEKLNQTIEQVAFLERMIMDIKQGQGGL